MLIAVVIIAVTYFIDDTGISYIMSFKCILWVSQALTEAEREECRKVRGNAKYKGAVSQPSIRRSIYESHIPTPYSPCGNTESDNKSAKISQIW